MHRKLFFYDLHLKFIAGTKYLFIQDIHHWYVSPSSASLCVSSLSSPVSRVLSGCHGHRYQGQQRLQKKGNLNHRS